MNNLILCTFFISFNLFAHPERLTTIKGDQINLQTINHSFSGSIKKRMVQGLKIAGKFESELTVIDKDQKYTANFKMLEDRSFGGEISLPNEQGQLTSHQIRLVKFTREKNEYLFQFGDLEVPVTVNAEQFDHGHYINPEYTMNYRGEKVSFRLNGEACYGYSAHLIAMIMSAFVF